MATVPFPQSRNRNIVIWTLRVLLGVSFLIPAVLNLSGQPDILAEFERVGHGMWLRYLTAALQLIGGLAVVVPGLSVLGAAVLMLVVAGAFVAQVTVLHTDLIHTFVLAALLGVLIYLQRDMLAKFAALRHAPSRAGLPKRPST